MSTPDTPGAPRPISGRTSLFKGFPCTCGHPELGGTHRTDGPCFVSPAPAETGTPTPETYAEYNRIMETVAFGDQLKAMADFARRLERERDQTRAENNLMRMRLGSILWGGCLDKITCGEVQKWVEEHQSELAKQLAAVTRERDEETRKLAELTECAQANDATLRHSLAAVTALLEKRTGALERAVSAIDELLHHGTPTQFGPFQADAGKCAAVAVGCRESLVATPEQALKEKEGRV